MSKELSTVTTDALARIETQDLVNEATRLMKYGPYHNINQRQAAQLVMYSYMIDANPWNREVYPTDKGPMDGVMLYRRKAKEYDRKMYPDGEHLGYDVSYRLAEAHEADFDPEKGDVAWVCELVNLRKKKQWEETGLKFFQTAIEAGATFKEAEAFSNRYAGECPKVTAVGVVDHREHFSGVEKDFKTKKVKKDEKGNAIFLPEMWDRNERAKKRAEKGALKKEYPDMLIASFQEVYTQDVEVMIQNAVGKMEVAEPVTTEAARQAATDLGLDPDEIVVTPKDDVIEGVTVDVQPEPYDPQGGMPNDELQGTTVKQVPEPDKGPLWDKKNSENIYETVTDSKGVPYKDKEISDLSFSFNGLNKKIKEFKHDGSDEDTAKLDELKLKRDAVHFYIQQKKE